MPDMVFRFDIPGSYLDVLVADDALLAMPREEIVGRSLDEVFAMAFPPDVGERLRYAIRTVAEQQVAQTVSYDLEIHGEVRQFEARISPIDSLELLAIVRDTTDHERSERLRIQHERDLLTQRDALARTIIERELERASKVQSVSYLAATMAHDVNNLLGVIGNYAAAIRGRDVGRGVRHDADAIAHAVEQGTRLTQRLLHIGGRTDDARAPVDLAEVVADLSDSLQVAFGNDAGVGLAVELPAGPVMVTANRSGIEQAVMNLVLNARDATESVDLPVLATVSLAERDIGPREDRPDGLADGPYAVISVVDGGGGIPLALQERIFEPMFSLKDGANFGLGLPIVRSVADEHGGAIVVSPAMVCGRHGTRMDLWIPVLGGQPRALEAAERR